MTAEIKNELEQTPNPPPDDTGKSSKTELANLALRTALLTALETNAHLLEQGPVALRINQLRAIQEFKKKLEDPTWDMRGYFIQPTGAGKTVLFGIMVRLLNQPTVIFVPRTSLLKQTRDDLVEICGFAPSDIGIIGERNKEFGRRITICTYQSHISLTATRNRHYLEIWKNARVRICDEAHRSLGKVTRERIESVWDEDNAAAQELIAEAAEAEEIGLTALEEKSEEVAFSQMRKKKTNTAQLGFTATPKLSAKHIKAAFGSEIARESYTDLAKAGILVKFKIIHTEGSLQSGKDLRTGTLTEEEEVSILEREDTYRKLLRKYVETNRSLPEKLKTSVFCANIEECSKFIEIAESEFGLTCIRVTSKDDPAEKERAEEGLRDGSIDLVVTVEKLTEGWNFPPLNGVIRARADLSPARILQGSGRASRAYPGKDYAYIFETDWKVLSGTPKGGNDEQVGNGETHIVKGMTENNNGGKRVLKRFNLIEALIASGENKSNVMEICALEGEQKEYIFLGFPPMDEAYFENTENVQHDLDAFAKAAVVTITELNTGNISKIVAVCANGEKVSGPAYLLRAIALGLAETPKQILATLKRKSVIEIKEMPLMDKAYFENTENVQHDLDAFAKAAVVTITELNMGNIPKIVAVCANGEKVSGPTYLSRAGVGLGLAKGSNEAAKILKRILTVLKSKIGIKEVSPMDKAYFENTENVRHDLAAFAEAAGKTIEELNTQNVGTNYVVSKNGEKVNGQTYILRAGIGLGLGKDNYETRKIMAQILAALKRKIGIEIKEIPPMNKAYFENTENVRHDLDAFAKASGKTIENLKKGSLSIYAMCANGESTTLKTYIRHAGVALGLAETTQDGKADRQILAILKSKLT